MFIVSNIGNICLITYNDPDRQIWDYSKEFCELVLEKLGKDLEVHVDLSCQKFFDSMTISLFLKLMKQAVKYKHKLRIVRLHKYAESQLITLGLHGMVTNNVPTTNEIARELDQLG